MKTIHRVKNGGGTSTCGMYMFKGIRIGLLNLIVTQILSSLVSYWHTHCYLDTKKVFQRKNIICYLYYGLYGIFVLYNTKQYMLYVIMVKIHLIKTFKNYTKSCKKTTIENNKIKFKLNFIKKKKKGDTQISNSKI